MAEREIHPLTRVGREKKLKFIIYALLFFTILNISIAGYLFLNNESLKSKSKILNEDIKANKQLSQNTQEKEKKSKEKLDIKINFPQIKDINLDQINSIEYLLENQTITNISFKQEPKKEKKEKIEKTESKQIVENNNSLNRKNKNDKNTDKKIKKDFGYYYSLAKKAEKIKDIKSALAFYHKAYRLNPDEDILFKIAYLNYKLKAYRGTLKYIKRLLKQNPNYIDAYILKAKTYEKSNNNKKAIIVLEEAYYKFGENPKILRELARLYERVGNIYSAIEIYEILSNKGNLKDIIKTAKLYEKAGIFDKAIFSYKKALEIDKENKYKQWLEDKISKLSQMNE